MVIFPQESARINRVLLNPMQTHTITGTQKNGKSGSIGTLRLFTKYVLSLNNETLVKNFVKEVPHSKKIGYAGFTEKEHLRDNLGYNIPDFENADAKHQAFSISEPELLHTIEESLRLCHKNVSTSPTNIFLFPTFSTFVKEKMGGVSGYTPYKNTLLLYISPQGTKRWKEALAETICHEFMHTVMDNHYERKNLLDDLVFEGVAESFVSFLFGVKAHMPSQAIPLKETLAWYHKLKKRFRNTKLYYPVFLEGKEYPLWAGYAIGYQMIETYRKKHPDISWDTLVKLTPKEIHEEAEFGK